MEHLPETQNTWAPEIFNDTVAQLQARLVFNSRGGATESSRLIGHNTGFQRSFAIITLRPFFLSLPGGLEEAAMIDGCNKFTSFTKIILPLVTPGLMSVAVFCSCLDGATLFLH